MLLNSKFVFAVDYLFYYRDIDAPVLVGSLWHKKYILSYHMYEIYAVKSSWSNHLKDISLEFRHPFLYFILHKVYFQTFT